MRFANPVFLIFALLVPVAGLWWSFLKARREKALTKLTLKVPKSSVAGVQTTCIVLGLFLSLFAASRPQWGKSMEKTVTRGRNVVIAIDVSRSMLAEEPNRLDCAKMAVADLIDSLAGDRCALVAFRFKGDIVCPLTTDYGYLKSALERMSPDSAPRGGDTDLGSAILKALEALDPAADDHNAIILISDGGELLGDALKNAVKSAEEARKRGIPIFTVGIGDPNRGATFPAEDGHGVKMQEGKPVIVKLEEEVLVKIADVTGGRYDRYEPSENTLGDIYSRRLREIARMEQNEEESRLGERYQFFLIPGLVLLILGAALSKGRFAKKNYEL